MEENKIRCLSLFSGCGGLDIGFDKEGYDILLSTDIDPICCKTLIANKGNTLSASMVVIQKDIWELPIDSLPKDIDLIIGGPPCQSFSASGRRAGGAPGRLDARGSLFEAYCQIIKSTEPKAFLFENVRGILSTNKGEDFKEIIASFSSLGYCLAYKVLDAQDYGVPQQRERLFIVGHKMNKEFLFPRPLFGPDSVSQTPHITIRQAIEDLPFTEDDKAETYFGNGKYSELLPLVPPGSNYLHFTAKRGHPNPVFAYRSRFSDFLYKADPNSSVKTLIASPGKYTGPLHWENRYLTIREYMRVQGFPDDHKILGSRTEQLRQIGNSVSPKIANSMALAIKQQIFQLDCGVDLIDSAFTLSFDKRKGEKARRTHAKHKQVVAKTVNSRSSFFNLFNYESYVIPTSCPDSKNVMVSVISDKAVKMQVYSDFSEQLMAKMCLTVFDYGYSPDSLNVYVELFGKSPFGIQTMWNAVDDWVKRSSSFRSLVELYGHFTEPHPIFNIIEAETHSEHPLCKFAIYFMNFKNCSVYIKKEHLLDMWMGSFGARNFADLAKQLRNYRYDIRCRETNIAIPDDVFMVAYPFTLPLDKQMNFSIKGN